MKENEYFLLEGDSKTPNTINPLEEYHFPLRGKVLKVDESWLHPKESQDEKVVSLQLAKIEKEMKEQEEDVRVMLETRKKAEDIMKSFYSEETLLKPLFHQAFSSSYRIKPKQKQNVLYLVRFEEGTNFFEHPISTFPCVVWKAGTFIPVLGVELEKKSKEKVLHQIRSLPGFVSYKETTLIHDYSFMDI